LNIAFRQQWFRKKLFLAPEMIQFAGSITGVAQMSRTIFERYGGFASISKVVSAFYDQMLESEDTARFFEGIDMRRLIDHQTKFISTLMGGPSSYSQEQLKRAHARLGIDSTTFDKSARLLTETLEDFDFDESDISEVLAEFNSYKWVIVTLD
jgi:hemoglobin